MSAREWIAARRELLDAATEGPWKAEFGEGQHVVIPHDAQSTREAVCVTRLFDPAADAVAIADAHTALPAALTALEQVLALHPAGECPTSSHYYCEPYECDQAGDGELRAHCDECREWWPCPTVKAIAEALGAEP